jgi:hypothetical protein
LLPEIARITYEYLRWLLICVPSVLFVVTTLTALQQGELERSIRAYYGGPVRTDSGVVPVQPLNAR